MKRRHPSAPDDFERWLIDAGRRERVPPRARARAHRAVSERVWTTLRPLRAAFTGALWSLCAVAAASFALAMRPASESPGSLERVGSGGGMLTYDTGARALVGPSRSEPMNTAGAGRF